jgi:WD40 repeat protein
VSIRDVTTGALVRKLAGHRRDVEAVAFSPDGKQVASAGDEVRVWDLGNGKRIRTLPADPLPGWIHFSRDGKSMVAGFVTSQDGSLPKIVRLWDTRTGRLQQTARFPGESTLEAVSPDCRTVATGTEEKNRVIRLRPLR